MTGSKNNREPDPISGEDVFAEIASLSKKQMTEMLLRMIESAADYHSWSLSDEDGARAIKLIKHKQRIICSSFTFQLNKHFSEFKSANNSPQAEKSARDWQTLGISNADGAVEINKCMGQTTSLCRSQIIVYPAHLLGREIACTTQDIHTDEM